MSEAVDEFVRGRSLWQDAMGRLRRNRLAFWGGLYVGLLLLACGIVPLLVDPLQQRTAAPFQRPSLHANPGTGAVHLFGTDELGRDLFARVFYGGRISFLIAIVATAVSVLIGTFYGSIAGYAGGRADNLMMRFVDVLYGLPYMFIVILVLVVWGRGLVPIFVALGCFQWLTTARIVRGQVISYKHREFVDAARTIGASDRRILFRHLLPNVIGPVIIYTTLTVPAVILLESFLSFLGLGVQEPFTSWGLLAAEGTRAVNPLASYRFILFWPAFFLGSTLLALNFLGDVLRDAIDPKGRRT